MRARPFLVVLLLAAAAHAAPDVVSKEISAPRVRLGDLVAVAPALAQTDVGPAPMPGSSRLFTRDEIARLLPAGDKTVIPPTVRVSRKTQELSAREVERLVRQAIDDKPLPKGVTVDGVQAAPRVTVAAGWTRATLRLPALPRQAGVVMVAAALELEQGGDSVGRVDVPLRLRLSPEAAAPLVAHGAIVSLTVRRGLVQVLAPAIASTDGNAGDVITVTVRSTSRVVRARVIDATTVVVVEGA